MKLSREWYNGSSIFVGIGVYFLIMNLLGLSDVFYLRLFNTLFVLYGVNKTIVMNLADGQTNLVNNAKSAMLTSLIGVFLSIIGLIVYSYMKGGDAYVQSLSKTFLFGGNPSVETYSICLFFEGVASSVVVTMLLLLYYNDRHKAD
ncbi:hypothetical protein [Flavobacterium restrictum]|uniref:DUF4199 domain-containing protein n=1 Tax=Flavobacterium restrictum TaxID=2594428 RepID=A0A553E375_9FLAO|nr:hypothetical protein [Flavobacterium restrictum]TRX39508.1 hypothetical protein FNW21_09465 [Flavobacterium restrictum]